MWRIPLWIWGVCALLALSVSLLFLFTLGSTLLSESSSPGQVVAIGAKRPSSPITATPLPTSATPCDRNDNLAWVAETMDGFPPRGIQDWYRCGKGPGDIAIAACGEIGKTKEQFYYVHRTLEGNGVITACFPAIDHGGPWVDTTRGKAGIMIRQSMDPGSPFVLLLKNGSDGNILLQWRAQRGGSVQIADSHTRAACVQLTRKGGKLISTAFADPGRPAILLPSLPALSFPTGSFEVGLAVTSNAAVKPYLVNTVAFTNVHMSGE